jgi:hypothetical protein
MAGAPTHVVMVKKRDSNEPSVRVGSAWKHDTNDWFTVRLFPTITLTDRDDIYINIYPNRELEESDGDGQA